MSRGLATAGQVFPGTMQINGCVFNLAMTKEHLDGAQIGARFEQMGCKAMAQRVRTDTLGDPRALRGLSASSPRNLGG
jgi:hypothetical protein